jgi:DNA-binding response OmpR family regulator
MPGFIRVNHLWYSFWAGLLTMTPKKKIIVTDDDAGIQEIFRLIFEKAGFETTVLSSGAPLLEDNFDLPDIFLLDKQLSGTDGLDLCRHLKANARTKDIPVIMVSATPDLRILSANAGADDYIEKPFMTKQLLDKVYAALHKRQIILS